LRITDRLLERVHDQQGFTCNRVKRRYLFLAERFTHVHRSGLRGRVLFDQRGVILQTGVEQHIGILHFCLFVLAHEKEHLFKLCRADGFGNGGFHTALLDADINNI